MKRHVIFGILIISFLYSCDNFTKFSQEPVSVLVKISVPDISKNSRDTNFTYSIDGVLKYRNAPYSGHVLGLYPNGKNESDISYWKGKKEGVSIAYHTNGAVRYHRAYIENEKNGTHTGWYADGVKKHEYNFIKGYSHGNHLTWYTNGKLYKNQNFAMGKEYGRQKIYRPDGKIRGNYVVRHDGKKFGLIGLKRCDKVETKKDSIYW